MAYRCLSDAQQALPYRTALWIEGRGGAKDLISNGSKFCQTVHGLGVCSTSCVHLQRSLRRATESLILSDENQLPCFVRVVDSVTLARLGSKHVTSASFRDPSRGQTRQGQPPERRDTNWTRGLVPNALPPAPTRPHDVHQIRPNAHERRRVQRHTKDALDRCCEVSKLVDAVHVRR